MARAATIAMASFAAVAHGQVTGLDAGNDRFPHGSCSDDAAESKTCCDVDKKSECHQHIGWAMEEGIKKHPHWYNVYGVYPSSSYADFQCALFWISWNKAEELREEGYPSSRHHCPRPCGSTLLDDCAEPPKDVDPNFDVNTQSDDRSFDVSGPKCPVATADESCECGTEEVSVAPVCTDAAAPECKALKCTKDTCRLECPSSSLPAWAIGLLALVLLALIGAAVYFLTAKEKPKKKASKKRAAPAPAPEPVAPATPAMPVRITTAPPVYSGVRTTADTIVRATPAAGSFVMQPATLFDALDTNHDGVLTRNEMQARMQVMQQAPMQVMQQAPMQVLQQAPMVQTVQMPVVQSASVPMMQVAQAPMMAQTVATAVPTYVAAGQPVSMFDMLDRNHDGVISRNEFR